MNSFTTRVEIRDANYIDYANLHKAMKDQGFRRYITSDDGEKYDLPDGEYDSEGSTSSETLEKAKAAARSTGKVFRVLVTKSAGRTWVLDKIS